MNNWRFAPTSNFPYAANRLVASGVSVTASTSAAGSGSSGNGIFSPEQQVMPEIRQEERDSSVRWHSNNASFDCVRSSSSASVEPRDHACGRTPLVRGAAGPTSEDPLGTSRASPGDSLRTETVLGRNTGPGKSTRPSCRIGLLGCRPCS